MLPFCVLFLHDHAGFLCLKQSLSPTGQTHCIMIGSAFYRGGGQGTGFSKQIVNKPPVTKPPSTEPTFSVTEKTSLSQALLYRLSGDYNPLHIDPSIGKKGGLGA